MIRLDTAHYMFGYYVLLSDRSSHLWEDLDRSSTYWTVFNEFARVMRELDRRPKSNLEASVSSLLHHSLMLNPTNSEPFPKFVHNAI